MAYWDKISERGNVQDRRSHPGELTTISGIGAVGIAAVILYNLVSGGSSNDMMQQIQIVQNLTGNTSQTNPGEELPEFKDSDSYEVFASTVLGSTTTLWNKLFDVSNKTYREPEIVLFRGGTDSGCGGAYSQAGPHYCPTDEKIYLDETFFNELTDRLGAQGGDVAEAYVIAHEVGHHVQNMLGTMDTVQSAQARYPTKSNALSVALELQADCYAGIWAHSVRERGIFENDNEINEAIDTAAAVGDDHIQQVTTGRIHHETWTHGSSEDRKKWFMRGYDTGDVRSCNTFQ